MRRALASIRISPADRPRLASRPASSRTTSTTWTRSPDASFSRFALYRCDQVRPSSPPLSTVTPQPISKFPGSPSRGTKACFQDGSDRTYCHAADRISPDRYGADNPSGAHAAWFVTLAVELIAGPGARGDRREPRPGRSGCRRVLDLHLNQAPRLGSRLTHDREAGRGQPGVFGADIPYLDPDHHRAPGSPAAPADLEQPLSQGRTPARDRPVGRPR